MPRPGQRTTPTVALRFFATVMRLRVDWQLNAGLWLCPFIAQFLLVSLLIAQDRKVAVRDNPVAERTLEVIDGDYAWSQSTRDAASNFLESQPAADLNALLLQLLSHRDSRVRRDALESIGRVTPNSELRQQVSVLASRDPDPLCQARARLILVDLMPTAPRPLPTLKNPGTELPTRQSQTGRRTSGPRHVDDRDPMEPDEHQPVSSAKFETGELIESSAESANQPRRLLESSAVRPITFNQFELPPSPISSAGSLPELSDPDILGPDSDQEYEPRVLDRPLAGPNEIFDNPDDDHAWPIALLEAPLGFSGPSGILPTEVQKDGHFVPVPDRWRSGFPNWDRYGRGHPFGEDYPYKKGHWWDPYNLNVLKGDYPIVGQHTFLKLTGQINSLQEYRQLPTPATGFESTANSGQHQLFGDPNQFFSTNYFKLTAELTHGNTSFKPVDWTIRLTPIFNFSYLDTQELGIVNPNVRDGTTRFAQFKALEEYFVEAKLKDLSPDYDFVSMRVGSQQFTSDFRGFIFSDTNRAIRLFGTRLSNRDQFNLAFFRQAEKDTNSQLNTFRNRDQSILIANYYRQDFVFPGYTANFSVHYNNDGPAQVFDENEFLARPDPVGVHLPHRVQAVYLGLAGDGHIGRVNLTNAFYWVGGRDSLNPIAGSPQNINAKMAAAEISYDRDWIRFRASAFYASGDKDPYDGNAKGFDSILDSPNFAGGQFSYWQRQMVSLQGVGLVNRFSLVPDLRSSKFEGQSNFVNPGLRLLNVGVDFELTPKSRLVTNASYLQFDSVRVLQAFTFQNHIRKDIGVDLSVGLEYRPLLSDNIILTAGYACLVPGGGFRDIYGTANPFTTNNAGSEKLGLLNSVFTQFILQY
ncbi:MAG: hypothetical protein JSS49_05115 [Planctomycetes bacterium]|nr:hypothetical protein [Planctomycetota bacterium]